MHRLRFRLRTLMVVIAVLAPVLAASIFALRTYWQIIAAMNTFYGPDGVLAREKKFSDEAQAGDAALRSGDSVEAEARYRSALALEPSRGYNDISYILVGLADSLVAQGHYRDAEPFYQRALEIREHGIGDDPRSWRVSHLRIAEVLDRYAKLLRYQGRIVEAESREGRAETIRAEWEHHKVEE